MSAAHDFHQGKQLAPGVYDHGGALHVDEAEFIRELGGNPESEDDCRAARRVIAEMCAEHGIAYEEED